MFLPLKTEAHDGRFRVGALGIILICFLVHILVVRDQANRRDAMAKLENQLHQCKANQQIKDLLKAVGGGGGMDEGASEPSLPGLESPSTSIDSTAIEVHQRLKEERERSLFYRLALVTGHFHPVNLITSLFTHADWMHLIMNMWFFYIVGVTMEKYWGFGKFIGLYLAFGVAGDLAFLFFSRHGDGVPLVGASGAIAGMMGAFALTHGDAKVTVFWTAGFRGGTMKISARIYLGFWVAGQLLDAALNSTKTGGVAYSAHITGFLMGLLAGKFAGSDGFYERAYKPDPGPKIWDKMIKDEEAGIKGPFMPLTPGPKDSAEPFAKKVDAAPSRDMEVTTLLNQGWHALDQGDYPKASDCLFRGIDRAFSLANLPPNLLETALTRMLEAAPVLVLPPGALYSWARRMEQREWWQWAIHLHDRAAADTSGSTSAHSRLTSLFRAASLRMDHALDAVKAVHGFEAVIAAQPAGPLAEEARARLASFRS